MIAVLLRLQWMQLTGRVVRSIRLLKQPKYLVGFIAGAAWMGLWVLRPMMRSRFHLVSAPGGGPLGAEYLPVIHQIAAVFVTIAVPLPWLLPWGRLGLPFRESELTMLLQAPLSRRQVIQYGLLKSEAGVLLSGFILPLFVGLGGLGTRLLMGCGTWMLFELWHLNGKWRALFNLRQTEIPAALARTRRLILAIGLAGFYAVLVATLIPFVMQAGEALRGGDFRHVTANLATLTWPPLLTALLAPGWWLTAPIFARGVGAFAVAAVPMLLAILAQREIVLRSKARFEEGALEHATKAEAKKSPTSRFAKISSRARTKRPFALEPGGPPELAIVWRNAVKVSRARWTRVAYAGATLLVGIAVLPAIFRVPDVTYGILAAFAIVPMFVMPLFAGMSWNNDLRADLPHIEMVRTWPVSARQFVLAEVISPALLSFGSSVFGAGVVLASLFGSRFGEMITGQRSELVLLPRGVAFMGAGTGLATVLVLASFLPMSAAVCFFSSALQNLATLFVPAWMAHTADRGRGVAMFGQRMLFSAALGLALFLALIPSALLVGAAVGAQWALSIPWSAWAFPLWGMLAAAPQLAFGWFIVQLSARLWERLDPSQEILELGR